MEPLTKNELIRIRQVNEMKTIAKLSSEFKLAYFPGANLVLLRLVNNVWVLFYETGPWFDNNEKVISQ